MRSGAVEIEGEREEKRDVDVGRRRQAGRQADRQIEAGRQASRPANKQAGRSGRVRAIQPPFTFNERARSLARLLARSLALSHVRRLYGGESTPRTKIGNAAVFAEHALAREFRGYERSQPTFSTRTARVALLVHSRSPHEEGGVATLSVCLFARHRVSIERSPILDVRQRAREIVTGAF